MSSRNIPLQIRILGGMLAIGVLWLWYSALSFHPASTEEFGTVTGTLSSAEEHISPGRSPSGYLDIRIDESSSCFRVPADGYLEYFQREVFFAEARKGAKIEMNAIVSDIDHPRTFILNKEPTVFVHGVSINGHTCCAIEDRIEWEEKNNRWTYALAAISSALWGFAYLRLRKRFAKSAD